MKNMFLIVIALALQACAPSGYLNHTEQTNSDLISTDSQVNITDESSEGFFPGTGMIGQEKIIRTKPSLDVATPIAHPNQKEQFVVTHSASVCIDPPEPAIVVSAEKDKSRYPGCIKWSAFNVDREVFESYQFMKTEKNKIAPLNQFAKAVISSWTGKEPSSIPTSQQLFNNPNKFGLIEVKSDDPKQSRNQTLIIWNSVAGGMIAYVIEELPNAEIKKGMSDLSRYKLVYPSDALEGELTLTDAATIAKSKEVAWILKETDADKVNKLRYDAWNPKFLRRQNVRLYWNKWIQGTGSESNQPSQIYAGLTYTYNIDLSALDFQTFIKNPNPNRTTFTDQEADILVPQIGDLNVTVFPIGSFSQRDARTAKARIDRDRLKRTLTTKTKELTSADSLNRASISHGALFCEENCEDRSSNTRMHFKFIPKESGCYYLAVVIWNSDKTKIVASWVEPLNVLPMPDNPSSDGTLISGQKSSNYECDSPVQIAQRFDIGAFPRFGPESDSIGLSARLTFIDFESYTDGFTMGFFENLREDGEGNQAWVLETDKGLRKDLTGIKKLVDERMDPLVNNSTFDLMQISERLKQKLFRCRDQSDEECPGWRALNTLMEVSRNTTDKKLRINATFRDTRGSLYYLPIHLLFIDSDEKGHLSNAIRIDQALPMPLGKVPQQRPCVNKWLAGLVVQDKMDIYDKDDWRKKWPDGLTNCNNIIRLTELRDYFRMQGPYKTETFRMPGPSEGLFLLAHHGASKIAEAEDQPEIDQIGPENIKRIFGQGSFTILAACSVGAMSEDQLDNSLFLHTLNERHVEAAIVSPFKVPALVAKRFLNALKKTLITLNMNTTLYDFFEKSKREYQNPAGDGKDYLIPWVNLFMLVGDGDLMICKP
jgi:hypothetical protein